MKRVVNVVDNDIYIFKKCDGSVKVNKLKFGIENIKTEVNNKYIEAPIVYNDDYEESYDGHNAVCCIEEGVKASSIDIYRKYWILSNGHICKFENDKFEEKFDCDRALDSLDVYDDENLIAWQEGGDLFAAVQKTQNSSGPKTENPKVKSGWYPNPDRTWSYYKDDVVVRSQWIHVEFIIIFIQL